MTRESKLITDFGSLSSAPRVVTIGTFDGVHRGHKMLLDRAVQRATEIGTLAIALTFEPVPASVLRPDVFPGRVCTAEEKLAELSSFPLEAVVCLRFDRELAAKTAEEFMAWICPATGMRELWIGEAFALGRNRSGDVAKLTEIGAEMGFRVVALPRLLDGDDVISSSAIRSAIAAGDVSRAERYLGRPFRVTGEVIHGAHLGRTIGFPTANVAPPNDLVGLADGIYVTLAWLPNEMSPRPAMTYVGTRPTVNTGARLIETHLLDFGGDLYGQTIAVDFLERLRGDELFPGIDALIEQLKKDEVSARACFADRGVLPTGR